MNRKIFILILLFLTGCFNRPSSSADSKNSSQPHYWEERESEYFTSIDVPYSEEYIVYIQKSLHRLTLYKAGEAVRLYDTNIRNELPDRLLEDDGQTPEGIFEVYQLAIITDPPWCRWIAFNTTEKAKEIFINENSAGKEILEEYEKRFGKIVTDGEIRSFNRMNPDTPLLRGFGIHGGGYYPNRDWTLGCPALSDEDVTELYDFLLTNPNDGIGTKVIIVD